MAGAERAPGERTGGEGRRGGIGGGIHRARRRWRGRGGGAADGRRRRGSSDVEGLEGSWERSNAEGGRGQFTVRGGEADSPELKKRLNGGGGGCWSGRGRGGHGSRAREMAVDRGCRFRAGDAGTCGAGRSDVRRR
jgi:hypothetical protein